MTQQDKVIGALCAWRENRGGGTAGLQSVLNVLQNRAIHRGTSIYAEATRRLQFSSMTAPGDPNLIIYPADDDPQWAMALVLAGQMADGVLQDITGGATSYYALSMAAAPLLGVEHDTDCRDPGSEVLSLRFSTVASTSKLVARQQAQRVRSSPTVSQLGSMRLDSVRSVLIGRCQPARRVPPLLRIHHRSPERHGGLLQAQTGYNPALYQPVTPIA